MNVQSDGAARLPGDPAGPLGAALEAALAAVREGARLALDPGEALRIDTKRNRNDVVTQVDRAVESLIAERLAPTGYGLVGEEGHTAGSWAGRVWVLDPIDGTLNYVAVHRHWAISLALVEDGRPVLGIIADPVDDRLSVALRGGGAWSGRLLGAGADGASPVAPSGAGDRGAGRGIPSALADGAAASRGQGDPAAEAGCVVVPGTEGLERMAAVEDAALADGVVIAQLHALTALRHLPAVIEGTRGLRCYGAAALELVEVAAGRAGCLVHTRLHPWDVAAGVLLCEEAGAVVTRLDGTRLDVRESGSLLAGTPSARAEMAMRLVEG